MELPRGVLSDRGAALSKRPSSAPTSSGYLLPKGEGFLYVFGTLIRSTYVAPLLLGEKGLGDEGLLITLTRIACASHPLPEGEGIFPFFPRRQFLWTTSQSQFIGDGLHRPQSD